MTDLALVVNNEISRFAVARKAAADSAAITLAELLTEEAEGLVRIAKMMFASRQAPKARQMIFRANALLREIELEFPDD